MFTVVATAVATSRRHTHTSLYTYCIALHYGCCNFEMFAKANEANIIFRVHLNLFAFFPSFRRDDMLLLMAEFVAKKFLHDTE